jgi:hypothetical protein
MTLRSGIGEVLLASVAREPDPRRVAELVAREDLDGLAFAAWFHGIGGYVHRAVAPWLPEGSGELARLAVITERTAVQHLRMLADVRYLARVLGPQGIPWLVVKGPTLAEPIHGAATLRWYSDLDVLVSPAAFRDAIVALVDSGAVLIDRNWTLIGSQMKGEVHVRLPSGTSLDLHWSLLNDRYQRDLFRMPTDPILERRAEAPLAGGAVVVPTLHPADNMAYVALHAILSGGHRLIWLKDVERLLASELARSDEIVTTARAWRAELALACCITRVATSIGVPGQGRDLLDRLRSAAPWAWVARAAWRASPAQLQDGSPTIGRLVARSTGVGQADSFRNLAAKLMDRLRQREEHREGTRRFADTDPRSDRFDSGGEELRDSYLDAVARS